MIESFTNSRFEGTDAANQEEKMRIYNNKPEFGDAGPHEAESFEALADEMQPNFEEWARDEENQAEYPDELSPRWERIAAMRREFLAGLVEVN